MKLKALLLATVIFIFSAVAWSDDNRRDGNWWVAQDNIMRIDYLVGFLDGMLLGHNFSHWKYSKGTKAQQACAALSVDSYDEYNNKYFGNVTVGQIFDGLNGFYADYKNRRIRVSGAIWLVVNGIVGMPEEELNTLVESWRQNAGN